MTRRLLLAAVLVAAAGCSAKGKTAQAPQSPPYVFPHSVHVDAEVACTNCHAGIDKSTALPATVRDVKLPAKSEACAGCHDPIPKLAIPARALEWTLTFSHAAHLPKVKGDCKACHKELPEAGDAAAKAPPMVACTACHYHAQEFAQARCSPCHVDLKRFPLKPVAAYRHEANFLQTHADWARSGAQTCAQCHDQTKCAECHAATTGPLKQDVQFPERVQSDFIHRGDWVSRHQIEASADPAGCRRCHGSGYCRSCHELNAVAPGVPGAGAPHPLPYANHSTDARRNIVACAGCHDQGAQSSCVLCHSTGGVNPHPPGFLDRFRTADKTKPGCRICHR
ncbi:MAG TPA: cytochrome c3 family protein [Anaeromyxobacteraceae bacterium]|nr:cytochrome c3 family protein [Anaeromyxobacteraceae bacterium]